MNPDTLAVVAAGVVLAAGLRWVLPALRARYEERYDDERALFRERHPDALGLVEAGSDRGPAGDDPPEPGGCPACGARNEPAFDFCGECGARLPEVDGGPEGDG